MLLEGSCHGGAIRFRVESPHPYPYQRCYCSICRKTAGGGGYAINLSGRADTLRIEGAVHQRVYHAVIDGSAYVRRQAYLDPHPYEPGLRNVI